MSGAGVGGTAVGAAAAAPLMGRAPYTLRAAVVENLAADLLEYVATSTGSASGADAREKKLWSALRLLWDSVEYVSRRHRRVRRRALGRTVALYEAVRARAVAAPGPAAARCRYVRRAVSFFDESRRTPRPRRG